MTTKYRAHVEVLIRELDERAEHGQDVSVADLERALDVGLPTARHNRIAEQIGPSYTTGQLQRLLRADSTISDEAVRDRQRSGRLIGCQAADRRWVWPAWQFDEVGGHLRVNEGVIELWRQLPWRDGHLTELVLWMSGPNRALHDRRPWEHAREHGLDTALNSAAGRARHRMSA